MIAVLISEAAARQFFRVEKSRYVSASHKKWNQDHPRRDFALIPGYQGKQISSEFNTEIRINELGFRGAADLEKPRIFVVGDSFVFGVGAEEQETIPARLQKYLAAEGKDFSVWNLGVPAYALPHYLDMLTEYMPYQPQHVVLCVVADRLFSGADDFFGTEMFNMNQKYRGRTQAKELRIFAEKKSRKFKRWLSRNSALYSLALHRFGPALRSWSHKKELDSAAQKRMDQAWERAETIWVEFKKRAQEHNFELTLVYMPSEPDVKNGYEDLAEKLQAIAERHQFHFINGLEVLAQDLKGAYYPIDGHLTAKGYDQIAQAIARSLSLNPRSTG